MKWMILFSLFVSLIPLGAQERDALVEYRNRNYTAAVEITLEEIAATPNNLDAYTVLTWSLIRLERYEEALRYGNQALGIRRFDHRIIESMGEAYFYLGRNNEALARFQEYANLNPTGDRIDLVFYFMGEIYLRLGAFHKADMALSSAVFHTPSVARWWSRLGFARQRAGELVSAQQAYREALRLSANLTEAQEGLREVEALLANQG